MPYTPANIKRHLYGHIEPFSAEHLSVGNGHEVYVEQSGKRDGIPVLFVHGGPGGGTNPMQRRFFDPEIYRIILFDQRGCGHSRPHAEIEHNTTWDLVEDMEKIREHLGITKWLLFGGSWGSTLSLLYAEKHPEYVTGIILRGVFLMMQRELNWFYKDGTSNIYPELYEDFVGIIPKEERDDIIGAYYRRLTSTDQAEQMVAAQRWTEWETNAVTLIPEVQEKMQTPSIMFALAFARLEAHYFINGGFLEVDDQVLRDAHKIAHIPMTIVQGRYDAICPPKSAYLLKKALPHAEMKMVALAGHSAFEGDIIHELVCATDDHAQILRTP